MITKGQILWQQNIFMLLFGNCLPLLVQDTTPLRVISFQARGKNIVLLLETSPWHVIIEKF